MKFKRVESLIEAIAPKVAYRREQYREAITRGFEAAQRSRRTKNWRASSASANTELAPNLEILRNRSRDLIRNDPYAARAASLIPASVVGSGISCNIAMSSQVGDNELQRAWDEWANSTDCDFHGKLTFAGIQSQVMRSVFESGEGLLRIRRQGDGEVPLSLQVLEPDHIATQAGIIKPVGTNRVVNGVEVDKSGRVVAYHMYDEHPGSYGETSVSIRDTFTPKRVLAKNIIHVFRCDRPGQLRGIPWLSPVMLKLRELNEFEDAYLVRAKISACFSAFIYDSEAPDMLAKDPNSDFELEKLAPGIIEHLPPGKDIKFAEPKGEGGEQFKFFVATHLKAVASGIGVSYEALSGDFSEVNFSSARMGEQKFAENILSWQKNVLNPQLNDTVFKNFLAALGLSRGVSVSGVKASWTAPKRAIIDPTKEIPAKIKEIRAGVTTLSDAVRQSGKDPQRHFEELASDKKALADLGLILDSDPSQTTLAGQLQIDDEVESIEGN